MTRQFNMIALGVLIYGLCLYLAGQHRNRDFHPRLHGVIWVSVGLLLPLAVMLGLGAASVVALIEWISS